MVALISPVDGSDELHSTLLIDEVQRRLNGCLHVSFQAQSQPPVAILPVIQSFDS